MTDCNLSRNMNIICCNVLRLTGIEKYRCKLDIREGVVNEFFIPSIHDRGHFVGQFIFNIMVLRKQLPK